MKIIFRSMMVASLVVLFATTATFAQAGMMGSGMMKSGMGEADTSGHQGSPGMGSGMMGSGMMKSGMMKGMMGSGMMKKCRGMMSARKGAGDIQALINRGEKLGLTDKQMTALKSIQFSLAKEIIKGKADLQVAEMELGDLVSQDGVKISSVESKLKQVQALRTEIRLSQIKAQLQARNLLSSEQRKMWKSGK